MNDFELDVEEILPDLSDFDPDLGDLLDSIPDEPLPARPRRPLPAPRRDDGSGGARPPDQAPPEQAPPAAAAHAQAPPEAVLPERSDAEPAPEAPDAAERRLADAPAAAHAPAPDAAPPIGAPEPDEGPPPGTTDTGDDLAVPEFVSASPSSDHSTEAPDDGGAADDEIDDIRLDLDAVVDSDAGSIAGSHATDDGPRPAAVDGATSEHDVVVDLLDATVEHDMLVELLADDGEHEAADAPSATSRAGEPERAAHAVGGDTGTTGGGRLALFETGDDLSLPDEVSLAERLSRARGTAGAEAPGSDEPDVSDSDSDSDGDSDGDGDGDDRTSGGSTNLEPSIVDEPLAEEALTAELEVIDVETGHVATVAPAEPHEHDSGSEFTERPRPHLPRVPVGEVDGFAAQVGAGTVGELADAPSPTTSPIPPAPTVPAPVEEPPALDRDDHFLPVAPTATTERSAAGVMTASPSALAPAVEPGAFHPCVEPVDPALLVTREPVWRRHLGKLATLTVAAAIVVAILATNPLGSDAEGGDGDAPAAALTDDPFASIVAEAAVPLVDVYASPDGGDADVSLEHPTEIGSPLVFLVTEQRGDWLRVALPVNPPGSTGWIRADQVSLSKHEYRIRVFRSAHRLELHKGGELDLQAPVAIGRRDTPDPGSTFYVKELLKPPDPHSSYGEFAYGLSGFSNDLGTFTNGEGIVAIHGTDDPSLVGKDTEAGSIRLANEDMEQLVGVVPLGTPVEIFP